MSTTPRKPSYKLQCTAGPAYDLDTHGIVPVNSHESYKIDTDLATIELCVRIQDFYGLPHGSPSTHPYFEHPDHKDDCYSIAINFIPKKPVAGGDLVFGNDFDRPIRDRMPPGSNYALKIVKWWIDPGLEGDVYADRPYLYGPALSSWNHVRICGLVGEAQREDTKDSSEEQGESSSAEKSDGTNKESKDASSEGAEAKSKGSTTFSREVIEEGAEGSGEEIRKSLGVPDDPQQRMKYYLNNTNKEAFMFEPGRQYKADFGNSYLGFSDFTLRLPGFRVTVTDYIDEKNHELRYVLKNKKTGELYFSLRFELLLQGQEEFKPAPGVQASSSEDTKEKDNQEKAEQKDENKDERKDEQDEDEVD